ncbi:hypothetical protein IMG5_201290 [Ichthyophthirius multifiliis]|uniref:Bacteriocin n=1 Tax=Ichthyophthirius multifiliis TaxID=5932 RepID=G0R5Y3_ICHMU|nr:hypothetical protein IMG5_201290 [Ichthyophthirius multifiliis]EGR27107.1 hypothetical protein IMG5_201290 [Ichthyophthirius multifiliis]|eukprot:XP_004023991.1 hypothetical protein IMG5_201290 [Ichthyophthirius multifiliis]
MSYIIKQIKNNTESVSQNVNAAKNQIDQADKQLKQFEGNIAKLACTAVGCGLGFIAGGPIGAAFGGGFTGICIKGLLK